MWLPWLCLVGVWDRSSQKGRVLQQLWPLQIADSGWQGQASWSRAVRMLRGRSLVPAIGVLASLHYCAHRRARCHKSQKACAAATSWQAPRALEPRCAPGAVPLSGSVPGGCGFTWWSTQMVTSGGEPVRRCCTSFSCDLSHPEEGK